MDIDLAQKAIAAALIANWKEAEKLNKELLRENPEDVDALNRLSRALAELGELKKAKKVAEKALRLDPFNTIASKSLSRWKGLRTSDKAPSVISQPDAFLEEPGKTKMLSLLHLGDAKVIAKLDAGDAVRFTPHSHRISVITLEGKYIGRLPDDISARLRKLISLGNSYKILIKSIGPSEIKVFIREEERAPKMADTPSFPAEKIDYISFTPPELVHKKDIVVSVEEES